MNPGHSVDLRRRIVACVESGMSRHGAAKRFAVSVSSVVKLMQKWERTGSLEPAAVGGHRRRKLADHVDWLHELSDEGLEVSLQTINDMLHHLGYSFKKKPAGKRARSTRHRRQTEPLA